VGEECSEEAWLIGEVAAQVDEPVLAAVVVGGVEHEGEGFLGFGGR
jgi:hypothetical protein